MAKVSRAYIKGTGADQSGSIQPGSTIYAQDILDLIDSAKWHDEGIENVYYDDTSHGIKVVKSSDPNNPVFIPVPKNSDIVNKLVKGVDKYELHSDSGLVAKTDLPSTLVTSVKCLPDSNELEVCSTTAATSYEGTIVTLPDSLKSASIEGNKISFNSLNGQHSVINLPDSLKSVSIDGNTLTFTSVDGTPSVINLPVTTGYLSDVSLEDGALVFTKDGSSDVRVTLPFVSKAITGVSLQGSNLVFTFSDDTTANITLPTQSEGGTTAGLLSGVRIDGNKLIFTVSGGNDITVELPSTSGDVDLTGLLYEPRYSAGHLYFKAKGSNSLTDVWLDGISEITEVSNDNLYYNDIHDNLHRVSLSSLTSGVLTGASLSGDNLVFTAKNSDSVSIPLADLTASGVVTGVSLSNGNLVFTVKGGDNITIPLSSSDGLKDVSVRDDGGLLVKYNNGTSSYNIRPFYSDTIADDTHLHFGWGGSLAYSTSGIDSNSKPYAPMWVPTDYNYMDSVIKSSVSLSGKVGISLGSTTPDNVESGYIYGRYYNPASGYVYDAMDFIYCSLPFGPSFSESSGTFTANVITNTAHNWDFVLMSGYLSVTLNGNILEAFPSMDSTSVLHLLQRSSSLTRFHGFAFPVGDFVILIDKYMFFANQVFDWNFNVANSFGMRFYLSSKFAKYSSRLQFTATAGKVLE